MLLYYQFSRGECLSDELTRNKTFYESIPYDGERLRSKCLFCYINRLKNTFKYTQKYFQIIKVKRNIICLLLLFHEQGKEYEYEF